MALDLNAIMNKVIPGVSAAVGTTQVLRRVGGTYNPTDGTTTSPTSTDYAIKLIGPPIQPTQNKFPGTEIKQGDAAFLIQASGLTVTPDTASDSLVIDGVTWKIVEVKPNPGIFMILGRK